MRPETRKYLYDILQACDLLEKFTQGKTFDDYVQDKLLQSGVERQFTIIGEALYQALKVDSALEKHITAARRIVNFRHALVHGYAAIEHATVWGVVERDLATLRREAQALLANAQPGPAAP